MGNPFNCGVYHWLNTVTGLSYVGSSANLKRRKNTHLRELTGGISSCYKLQNAWNKYGSQAFEFEVIAYCPVEDLLWQEQIAINAFNAVKNGYNISPATDAPMRGRKASKETREKLSQYRKEHPPTSACELFQEAIILWLQQTPQLDASTIWKQLQVNGYSGGVQSVYRFVRSLRSESVGKRQTREWNEYLSHPNSCPVCASLIIPRKKDFYALEKRKYCSRICANTVNNKRSAAVAA